MQKLQFPILNVKVNDTVYSTDGNSIKCEMAVSVNLNNFEQQFFTFTPAFVKKVIGKHLPIIKTVINHNMENPVVAKYYILPGGPVKVLEFNRDYYKRYRGFKREELLNIGQEIPINKVPKSSGECEMFDYCESFMVTGKAICHPDDTFNLEKGKVVAQAKAIVKASARLELLFNEILDRANKMITETNQGMGRFNAWAESANNILTSMKEA